MIFQEFPLLHLHDSFTGDMETDAEIMRDFDECIFLNKLGMLALGIWPMNEKPSRLMYFGRKIHLGVIYFLMSSLLIIQWFDVYYLWGDVDAKSEIIMCNAFVFAVIMKISNFLKYMDTFKLANCCSIGTKCLINYQYSDEQIIGELFSVIMETDAQILQKFDESMFLNKLGMITLGIWPLDKKASRLRIFAWRIHLAIVYSFLSVMLCVQWFDMYTLWGNVDANSETFLSNAFIFAAMVKFSCFVIYMDTIRDILQKMRANWLHVMRECETHNKEVMYTVTMKARSRRNKYYMVLGATGMIYIVMPFLRDSPLRVRKYPFFGRYYFDEDSDLIYLFCYCSQLVTGSICGLANCVTDSMFLVCTYHFCAQLQILQNDLMDLGYEDNKLNEHNRLISLIKRHQTEIKNAQALQSMFSQSSLQQVLLSCLMICMNGFKLIVSLNNRDVDFVRYLVCLPLMLWQILCYCHPGNELIIQSQSLDEAIYQSEWINMDQSSIKNLIFMIQRSQRPLAVTAGKIYVLSLENFMKIVKTSMSGLSVLQAVYRRDD